MDLLAGDDECTCQRGGRHQAAVREFKLPTLAAEMVGRFSDAGHADALPTLVEVLEQEAEDRRVRRVDRAASKLPAGKTWAEHERAPVRLRQQLESCRRRLRRSVNVLASVCPAPARRTRCARSGTGWCISVLFVPAVPPQDMVAASVTSTCRGCSGRITSTCWCRRPGLPTPEASEVLFTDSRALRAPLDSGSRNPRRVGRRPTLWQLAIDRRITLIRSTCPCYR